MDEIYAMVMKQLVDLPYGIYMHNGEVHTNYEVFCACYNAVCELHISGITVDRIELNESNNNGFISVVIDGASKPIATLIKLL